MGIDRPPMTELDPYGYLSPPLDGLWLRAPYLHNGSVPTLRDLLNPPDERPQTFHRGYDVYDPVKVGFARARADARLVPTANCSSRYFLFDTRRRGEGNGGHLYGTSLLPEQKDQLIEYLKTL